MNGDLIGPESPESGPGRLPAEAPFPAWERLVVGDVLCGAGGQRYLVRGLLPGGLRIENEDEDDSSGIQDRDWHGLMSMCEFPAGQNYGTSTHGPDTGNGAPAPGTPAVVLTDRFRAALNYTFELHSAQRRKGEPGVPYLGHLLGVCSLVLEDGGSEDEAIAALLHDAVEDAGGQPTLDQIRRRFGKKVARIVWRCSDSDVTPKLPWPERKESFIARLGDRRTTVGTLRVVAADKLYNARAILDDYRRYGERVWERFTAASAETQLWYYRSVAEVLLSRIPGPMPFELDRTVGLLRWFVASGGVANAIAGGELNWTGGKNHASTIGRNGTEWAIGKEADGSFGITVAQWDRPDWYADTLRDAKQLVTEMDSRPPFWRELMTKDWLPPAD